MIDAGAPFVAHLRGRHILTKFGAPIPTQFSSSIPVTGKAPILSYISSLKGRTNPLDRRL